MEGFLSKPINMQELTDTLAAIFERQAAASETAAPAGTNGAHVNGTAAVADTAWDALRDRLGETDEAILSDILETFVQEADTLVTTLHQAHMATDRAALGGAAHSLKSSAALLGFDDLSTACAHLEASAPSAPEDTLAMQVTTVQTAWQTTATQARRMLHPVPSAPAYRDA